MLCVVPTCASQKPFCFLFGISLICILAFYSLTSWALQLFFSIPSGECRNIPLIWLRNPFSVAFKFQPYELVTQNYVTVIKSIPIKRFFLKSQSKSYQSGKEIPFFSGIRMYITMLTKVTFWIFFWDCVTLSNGKLLNLNNAKIRSDFLFYICDCTQ